MRKFTALILFALAVAAIPGRAQSNRPTWTVDPAAFDTNMDVTIQVFFNSTEANSGGMIGAFIDGTIHGIKDGGATSPNGKYIFTTRVYGNYTDIAKVISFKYYDTVKDKLYDLTETTAFVADGITGTAIVPLVYHTIPGMVTTLTDLKVSGTSIAGFSSSTLTYTKELAYGTVVTPTVTVTSTDNQATIVITNAASLPGSTTIAVTSEDDFANTTYTVNFTIAKNNNPNLSDLKVSGTTVTGFSASTVTYTVSLPHNTSTVPIVTATTTDTNATKVINATASLPGTTNVLVTAEDGTTKKTYSVNFTLAPDTDATLSSLTVNGTDVSGFASETLTYNVALPYGTIVVAMVTATTNDPNAAKIITQSSGVTGTATIAVTAEDGSTRKTYTIGFTVAAASHDATLSELKYNGTSVPGFAVSTINYSIELPYGTVALPVLTATTTYQSATKVITNPAALPGSGTVRVTAQDGISVITYTVSFTVIVKSTDATLKDLTVGGAIVPGFSPATLEYNYKLPFAATNIPTVSAVTNHAMASEVIVAATGIPGTTTIEVTAENGIDKKTYKVNFSHDLNNNANLRDLRYADIAVPGFSPAVIAYSVIVPYEMATPPDITAIPEDTKASVLITKPSALPGLVTVRVTAEDGTTVKTYTIQIDRGNPSTDATLMSIMVDGVALQGFNASTLIYDMKMPCTYVGLPVVTAFTNDNFAKATYNHLKGFPGNDTITIVAQDATTKLKYVVRFTKDNCSGDASLKEIKIDGQAYTGFNRDVYSYTLTGLPDKMTLPTITLQTSNGNSNAVVTKQEFKTTDGYYRKIIFTVTVTAEDGITQLVYTFELNFTLTGIDENIANLALDVFPNPTHGRFELNYTSYNTGGTNIRIEVLDITGRIIYSLNREKDGSLTNVAVDLSQCQPGLYFVRVRSGQDIKIKRININ